MFLKIFAMLLMLDVATFCEKFLIDAEYLIKELGRIRQLALSVPLTRDSYGPTNSVVDAVWNLEERIRYLRGLEESKKTNAQLRRRKRNGDDTPEDDSPAVSESRRDQWKRDRHQQVLFDTEELSGLRSAEFSRALREAHDKATGDKNTSLHPRGASGRECLPDNDDDHKQNSRRNVAGRRVTSSRQTV